MYCSAKEFSSVSCGEGRDENIFVNIVTKTRNDLK